MASTNEQGPSIDGRLDAHALSAEIIGTFMSEARRLIAAFKATPHERTLEGNRRIGLAQIATNAALGNLVFETISQLPPDMERGERLALISQLAPTIDTIADGMALPFFRFGREAMAVALERSIPAQVPPSLVEQHRGSLRRALGSVAERLHISPRRPSLPRSAP